MNGAVFGSSSAGKWSFVPYKVACKEGTYTISPPSLCYSIVPRRFSFYLFNTWYSLKAFVFNEETRSLRSSRIESAHDKSLTSPSLQLDLSTSSLITAALVTRKLHTTSGGRAQVRAPRGNERPLRREEDKSAAEKRIRDLARLLL